MRRRAASLAALVMALLLLAGCQGNPLPAGMDEDALLEAGKTVVLQLVGGDYEAVCAALRPDVAETVAVEDIQSLMLQQTDGAGVYKQIDSSMATGQSSDGEDYGVGVYYCQYAKKKVLFRIAFDADMQLIGMEVKKQ